MDTTNTTAPSQQIRTASDLNRERHQKLDDLLRECAVFWAFSEDQFHANKTPLRDGEKYVSIGAGGYLPKGNAEKLKEGMERIRQEFNAVVKANRKLRRDLIAYELRNHEAHYTGDITDTMEALGEGFTAKEVRKVYQEMQVSL